MKLLDRNFFKQDTIKVAKDLLGKIIEVNGIKARIVETEAYGQDKASHAFKKTDRSALMYETYGHIYVYLIYGMYNCLNFTTEDGRAGAVLIRAVEPLNNFEVLKERRKTKEINNLCSGPGKLCIALNIDRKLNGLPIGKEIKLFDDWFKGRIEKSTRIGIKDDAHLEWRFFVKGNEHVSKI